MIKIDILFSALVLFQSLQDGRVERSTDKNKVQEGRGLEKGSCLERQRGPGSILNVPSIGELIRRNKCLKKWEVCKQGPRAGGSKPF